MMSALSRSLTGLAEALTSVFFSSSVARRGFHKALPHLARRDLNVKSVSVGSSRGGPSAHWWVRVVFIPERQPFMKVHH